MGVFIALCRTNRRGVCPVTYAHTWHVQSMYPDPVRPFLQ